MTSTLKAFETTEHDGREISVQLCWDKQKGFGVQTSGIYQGMEYPAPLYGKWDGPDLAAAIRKYKTQKKEYTHIGLDRTEITFGAYDVATGKI